MRSFVTVLFASFTLLNCILTASVTNNPPIPFAQIARKSFLRNLNKKFTEKPIEPSYLQPYRAQNDKFHVAGIEDTLLRYIFEYLTKSDLDKLKNLSTNLRSLAALALADKLRTLCPYYTFPVNWLNELFYTFLVENEMEKAPISENDLEMINSEYVKFGNDLKPTIIPLNLKFLIISFLNELVYGVDQHMPANVSEWRYNLMRRLSKYSYSSAFILYQDVEVRDAADGDEDWQTVTQIFAAKLLKRPTSEELDELVNWSAPFEASALTAVAPEVACAFIELSLPRLRRDEDRIIAIEFMFESNSFSQIFWDYIRSYPRLLEDYFETRVENVDAPRWNKELVKLFLRVQGNEALMYLLTRSAKDPFDIEMFKRFNLTVDQITTTLKEFMICSTGSLMEKEILEELGDLIPAELQEIIPARLL